MRHSQESEAMLTSLVDNYVAPLLSSKGFRQSKLVWNRRLYEVTHVLDIQVLGSKAEKLNLTINLGVFAEQVWRVVWDKPVPKTIPEVECFPRLRIGKLIGEGPLHKHVGWIVDATTDIDAVGSELQGILVDKGLPFLDRLDSVSAVLAVVEDPMLRRFPAERMSYAVLKYLVGQRNAANEILTEMLANPKLKTWHDRVRGVSERLATMP